MSWIKWVAAAIAGGTAVWVAGNVIDGDKRMNANASCSETVAHWGSKYGCTESYNHKGKHRAVVPESYDPYFKTYEW